MRVDESAPIVLRRLALIAVAALVLASCGGGSDDTADEVDPVIVDDEAAEVEAGSDSTEEPDPTEPEPEPEPEPDSTEEPDPEPTDAPVGEPLVVDGSTFTIDWGAVAPPFYSAADASAADPFFFVHTQPEVDGFYFALEMYTTGYGALWQGELGEVAVSCAEGVPAPNSTGICPQFDPDGPGPLPPLDGFGATGSIVITQLDADGYDIDVVALSFPSGEVIAPFNLSG